MKSILHGLYNGDIIPWERPGADDEARGELLNRIEQEERHFIEKMSLDDCRRFEDLARLYREDGALEEESIFSYGFTLGFLMAGDIAEEQKRILGE